MKIVVVSGSSRAKSESLKVSKVLVKKLQNLGANTVLVDLFEAKLPIYDDTEPESWQSVKNEIKDAAGFILVSPEWNGSASPAIMNFLTYTSSYGVALAHRPTLIVGVSDGAGGAYPISQLKAYGNKNNHPVFVPEHLRIRDVNSVFNSDSPEDSNHADQSMHKRADYALKVLLAYSEKLAEIRDLGVIDLEAYPYGN